jgi:hypothetical protein
MYIKFEENLEIPVLGKRDKKERKTNILVTYPPSFSQWK